MSNWMGVKHLPEKVKFKSCIIFFGSKRLSGAIPLSLQVLNVFGPGTLGLAQIQVSSLRVSYLSRFFRVTQTWGFYSWPFQGLSDLHLGDQSGSLGRNSYLRLQPCALKIFFYLVTAALPRLPQRSKKTRATIDRFFERSQLPRGLNELHVVGCLRLHQKRGFFWSRCWHWLSSCGSSRGWFLPNWLHFRLGGHFALVFQILPEVRCLIGMFLGAMQSYLLTFGVWKPVVMWCSLGIFFSESTAKVRRDTGAGYLHSPGTQICFCWTQHIPRRLQTPNPPILPQRRFTSAGIGLEDYGVCLSHSAKANLQSVGKWWIFSRKKTLRFPQGGPLPFINKVITPINGRKYMGLPGVKITLLIGVINLVINGRGPTLHDTTKIKVRKIIIHDRITGLYLLYSWRLKSPHWSDHCLAPCI